MVDMLLTACFLAGVALLSFGVWLAWHPGGYITAGAALIIVPVLYARGGRAWASSTA